MSKFAYIFDPLNFQLKEFLELSQKFEINEDEETNTNSIFNVNRLDNAQNLREINAQELDFIFVRDENDEYIYKGIVKEIINDYQTIQINCKNIINMFDENVINEFGDKIKNEGIEDFFAAEISTYYAVGPYGQNFIRPIAKTHNTYNIEVPTTNNIFNLSTYMNNCKTTYDLKFDFNLTKDNNSDYYYLDIIIEKNENTDRRIIDLRLLDQSGIVENYNSNVLACVSVISENFKTDKKIYRLFLKNDRTTTQDITDPDIIFGKKTTICTTNFDTANQEALNQFSGNRYDHYFNFKSNEEYKLGEKVIIYNLKGEIFESYISAKKDSGGAFKEYTSGKLRVKFLDKFLKEKR